MRAIFSLGLLMLAVPATAVAGPSSPLDDSKQLVCVKKAAEPARAGQRAAPSTVKCRWVQRIPAVIDPTPTFIL